MKGPYRILLVCSILVLVGVWLLGTKPWQAEPPASAPAALEETDPHVPEGSAPPNVALDGDVEREELSPAPSQAPESDLPSFLLRVLERNGGAPVPEAKVHVFYDRTIEEDPEQIRTSRPSTVETVYQADAHGLVHLRTPERYTWMEGYREDLYGWASFPFSEPEPEEGWILLLEPDQGFEVLAVDSTGEPIPGIPLGVGFRSFQPSSQRVSTTSRFIGVTDADGIIPVRHTQLWGVLEEEGRRPVELALKIVGDQRRTATVDLENLPSEPVQVVCPATGAMRIRVEDPFGQPWKSGYLEGSPYYGVFVTPLEAGGMDADGRYLDDFEEIGPGEILLRNVALGRSYEVRLHTTFGSDWTTHVAGPTRAFQEVEVELRPPANSMILSGALVGENGPLGGQGLNLELETQPDQRSGYAGVARTTADGRFWVVLRPELRGVQLDRVELDLRSEPFSRYGGVITVPYGKELHPGFHDLGRIPVAPPPLVVSGRFVHDGRLPTASTRLVVERLRQRSTGEEEWIHVSGLTSSYGPDGTFEVRGEAPASPLRIMAGGNRFAQTEPIGFRLGATDLEVQLTRTGTIELEVLHDRRIAPDDTSLNMELTSENGGSLDLSTRTYVAGETDRKLRWWSVPPGRYRLEISPRTGGSTLAAYPDIEVHSGNLTQLEPLDLRGVLTRASIRILDGSGTDVRNNMVLVRRSAPGAPWSLNPNRGGDREILLAEDSVDLLVFHRDHRLAHVRQVREDTTVTLRPGFDVTLDLDGLESLPRGLQVRVQLQGTEEVRARLPDLGPDVDAVSELMGRVLRHSVRDAGDRAELRLPIAGKFEVSVTLRGNRSATIQGVEPAILDVAEVDSPQRFRIRIPEKGLQEALERVNR